MTESNCERENFKKIISSYVEINDDFNTNQRIEIARPIGRRRVLFEIRNDASNFKADTWKRLVAVFIEGIKNEFREWPDGTKPAILFSKGYFRLN